MGGLTKNPNIRSFKMEFGGEIAHVYSGYEANSKIGQFILWLRAKKSRKDEELGALIISLDFELNWGVHDVFTIENYGKIF